MSSGVWELPTKSREDKFEKWNGHSARNLIRLSLAIMMSEDCQQIREDGGDGNVQEIFRLPWERMREGCDDDCHGSNTRALLCMPTMFPIVESAWKATRNYTQLIYTLTTFNESSLYNY